MFKVGETIWDIEKKRYLKITEIDLDLLICGDSYILSKNAHQTAQTMFEALGYEKGLDFPDRIINYEKFDGKGYGKYISFDSLAEDYICGEIIPKVPQPEIVRVSKEEHLAIHQQMIEMGVGRMKSYKIIINKTYKTYIEANNIEEAKEIATAEYENEGGRVYFISAESDLREVGIK